MKARFSLIFAFAVILFSAPVMATVSSAADADKLWQESKNKPGYNDYALTFIKYSNANSLNSKDNCFKTGGDNVVLYLVFTDKSVIEQVVTDKTGDTAACFSKTYSGLQVQKPPFSPLVIKMNMKAPS